MTILDEIAAKTRERIAKDKEALPPAGLLRAVERRITGEESLGEYRRRNAEGGYRLHTALSSDGISYICEVKKASPSKGLIAEDFPYLDISKEYEEAGASAISCLTEPHWFLGSDKYLEDIVRAVEIPVLRKDFTIDEYMIYQARALGASAVLLICAILDDKELAAFYRLAGELGLDCLVEVHDEEEMRRAREIGALIIGVNNRNLHDFSVDPENALRLRELAGSGARFVSESGIKTADDIEALRRGGVDAVLIGEALMRAEDKRAKLIELNGGEL